MIVDLLVPAGRTRGAAPGRRLHVNGCPAVIVAVHEEGAVLRVVVDAPGLTVDCGDGVTAHLEGCPAA